MGCRRLIDSATVYRRGDAGFAGEVFAGRDAVIPLMEVGCYDL
jgi:hypothetical protein